MNGNSFQEIGFTRLIDRFAVALAIRASVEWTSACSASAQAMVFELGPPSRIRVAQRASVLRRKTRDYLGNELLPPPERRRLTIRSGRVSSRDSPSKNRRT